MSQSTRSGSKLAQRLSTDEQEVKDALLDRSDGASGAIDQADAVEESVTGP